MITLKILFTPFPEECCGTVYGICGKLSENEYGICIDSTLPDEIQKAVLWHEKAHIYLGHLDSCLPIRESADEAEELEEARIYLEDLNSPSLVSEFENEAEAIAIVETGISPHKFER